MRWFKLLVFSSLPAIFHILGPRPDQLQKSKVNLDLQVNGFSGQGASLHLAAFTNEDGFPDSDSPSLTRKYKISKGQKSTSLKIKLPAGDYAIAIFEDLNGNGSLDRNFFGIPTEPYGFSRNFQPSISAPDFSDCSIHLEKSQSISIKLIN